MPIAMETLAEPNTLLTTVGMVEKNPPFDMPFTTTNNTIGVRLTETGHIISILRAVKVSDMNSVLSAPNLSQRRPQPILPTAEDKLKPATRAAPVLEDRPMDLEYNGRKKGGTNRGNVPIAPARKTTTKVNDRNKRLYNGIRNPNMSKEWLQNHTTPQRQNSGLELSP